MIHNRIAVIITILSLFVCSLHANEKTIIAPCIGTVNSYPYQESFESSFGLWSQDTGDAFDWSRGSDETPSVETGPTLANAGTYYAYIESSTPNFPNKITILNSPCFDLGGQSSASFNFDYHMYGAAMGTVKFEANTDNGDTWQVLWTKSGDQGNVWANQTIDISSYAGFTVKFRYFVTTGDSWRGDFSLDNISVTTVSGSTNQGDSPWSTSDSNIHYIDGNVGIGTTAPDAKLTVKGDIHTQEVLVDLEGVIAPDYVFLKSYDLKTLEEVQNHINEHGHLPSIPSAEEMERNGVELKMMNLKLLEKIEELTLYTLQQQRELEAQKDKNKVLETRLKKLEVLTSIKN